MRWLRGDVHTLRCCATTRGHPRHCDVRPNTATGTVCEAVIPYVTPSNRPSDLKQFAPFGERGTNAGALAACTAADKHCLQHSADVVSGTEKL